MLSDTTIRESLRGHEARNAKLLDDLKAKHADLATSRSIDHHFWAPDQRSAALLAKSLYDRGYLVLMISPAETKDGQLWNVEAGFKRSLVAAASAGVTEELVTLAAQFDAEYDGWGSSI